MIKNLWYRAEDIAQCHSIHLTIARSSLILGTKKSNYSTEDKYLLQGNNKVYLILYLSPKL